MSDQAAILAPAGWGFVPGVPLTPPGVDSLPDMPMLQFLAPIERNAAVLRMLREHPQARGLQPRHLCKKYGLPQVTASALLHRAKAVA